MAQKIDNVYLTSSMEDISRKTNYRLGETTSLLYCRKGTMRVRLESRDIELRPGDLQIIMPRTFIRSLSPSYDFQFYLLRAKSQIYEDIFFECFRMEPFWWEKQQLLRTSPLIHLSDEQRRVLEAYYTLFRLKMSHADTSYRHHILQAIAHAAVMEVLHMLDAELNLPTTLEERANIRQSDIIFRRFMTLLQANTSQREVQFFAEKIGITPKYLTEICKQCSGKLPTEWIAEVAMTEIVRLLRTTQLSVKEIAYDLHFPNSSFFCQYVKKHTGKSPLEIRRETK